MTGPALLMVLAAAVSARAQNNHSVMIARIESGHGSFDPPAQLTVTLGDNCRMELDLFAMDQGGVCLHSAGDTSCATIGDVEHRLFPLTNGGFEWAITLHNRPPSNRFDFPLRVSGLRFFLQDSLTAFERERLRCHRPDSVVGSYAVYCATGKGSERVGEKAFHIFRPRAWDEAGDTVWCHLLIDTTTALLTLTVPATFLENAEYPVTIDPTFGSTRAGASSFYLASGHVRHCRFTLGPETGMADSVSCYVHFDGVTDSLGVAIYDDNDGEPGDLVAVSSRQISDDWSTRWYSFAIPGHPTLGGNASYWLSLFVDGSAYLMYDDLDAGVSEGHFSDAWPPSDPAACNWNPNDYTFSIYCTYHTVSGDIESRRRRVICGGI